MATPLVRGGLLCFTMVVFATLSSVLANAASGTVTAPRSVRNQNLTLLQLVTCNSSMQALVRRLGRSREVGITFYVAPSMRECPGKKDYVEIPAHKVPHGTDAYKNMKGTIEECKTACQKGLRGTQEIDPGSTALICCLCR